MSFPPQGQATKADLIAHAALDTGTHEAGTDVLATDADIQTHAELSTVHQNAPQLITTHKSDASAHHAKYLDSEAKAQAEGAKLDDHAAPDDNTDLNASGAKHGLMPKADKTKLDGATSAATASKLVIRDVSARAKFGAPGAAGDALIKGTRVTTAELPALTDEKIWKGTGNSVEEVDMPISLPVATVGDVLENSADAETAASGITYVKVKEIQLPPRAGAYRIKFDLKNTVNGEHAFGRIYKNGVAVGTEQDVTSDTYATLSEDIAGWAAGDLCQLYRKETGSGNASTKNFRVYCAQPIMGAVRLDT